MERSGFIVLTLVSLVTASPYGYGAKSGAVAVAKAEASAGAGAFGVPVIPLNIPDSAGLSGSFSKSSSSSFASSSASSSSSSSSFSFSGAGANALPGLGSNVLSGTGCLSGGCNGGKNELGSTSQGSNGIGGTQGSNINSASASAGAIATIHNPNNNGVNGPCAGSNCNDYGISGKKCASGHCGSIEDTNGNGPQKCTSESCIKPAYSGSTGNSQSDLDNLSNDYNVNIASKPGQAIQSQPSTKPATGQSSSPNTKFQPLNTSGKKFNNEYIKSSDCESPDCDTFIPHSSTSSNGKTLNLNKPSTYLETPYQESDCTTHDCISGSPNSDSGSNKLPSSYNVPILGVDTNNRNKPSPNCLNGKCQSSYDDNKNNPLYSSQNPNEPVQCTGGKCGYPSFQPSGHESSAISPTCTSGNCANPSYQSYVPTETDKGSKCASGDCANPSYQSNGPTGPGVNPSIQPSGPTGPHGNPSFQPSGPTGHNVNPSFQPSGPTRPQISPSLQPSGPTAPQVTPSIQPGSPTGPQVNPSIQPSGATAPHLNPAVHLRSPTAAHGIPSFPPIGTTVPHSNPSVQPSSPIGAHGSPSFQPSGPIGPHFNSPVQHTGPTGPTFSHPGAASTQITQHPSGCTSANCFPATGSSVNPTYFGNSNPQQLDKSGTKAPTKTNNQYGATHISASNGPSEAPETDSSVLLSNKGNQIYTGGFGGPVGVLSTNSGPTIHHSDKPHTVGNGPYDSPNESNAQAYPHPSGAPKPGNINQSSPSGSPSNSVPTNVHPSLNDQDKPVYSGGFGGPTGLLKPNEHTIQPNTQKPACASGNCGSNLNNQLGSSNGGLAAANAVAKAEAVAYSGGFGGPPGVLKAYDGGKVDGKGQQNVNGKHSNGQNDQTSTLNNNLQPQNSNGALTGSQVNAVASASATAIGGGYGQAGCNSGCSNDNNSAEHGKNGTKNAFNQGGSIANASASAKSVAGATSYGQAGSVASASAHASAGASVKGGYAWR